jgi:DNA mismatch endonuclease (patch repair protein)
MLHGKDLPGKPDLVFRSRRQVIFVHGCFWHSHDCKAAHVPKSNLDYWEPKLQWNKARDRKNLDALTATRWKSLVIWECELKDIGEVRKKVRHFLGNTARNSDAKQHRI